MTRDAGSPVDVVVIGDGPAGSALATACVRARLGVTLIGPDEPWTNTYGSWLDDLAQSSLLDDPQSILTTRCDQVVVHTDRRHDIDHTYAVLDNTTLRTRLRRGVTHHAGLVVGVDTQRERAVVRLQDHDPIECRLVIDAAGWPARFATATMSGPEAAWQTAFGVVLTEPPTGDLGQPTVMDFRHIDNDPLVTFCYSLPVADGWLVEETVLAARPAVDPDRLRTRLASRLSTDVDTLLSSARRTETVRIPMGGPLPDRTQPIAAFGAAAGSIHPISGYSIAASIADAPSVADTISATLAHRDRSPAAHAEAVWDTVWSLDRRRARVLHDYGLEFLVRLDASQARSFFGTFFDLPTNTWSAFMRSSTSTRQLARTMTTIFGSAPMPVKRQLVGGNPLAFSRLVWPR